MNDDKNEVDRHSILVKENANETSIHAPIQPKPAEEGTDILWTDINSKLEQNKHLDEDELLELKQHLEHQKRQALLQDILRSSHYLKEVSKDKIDVEPENNKCLDNVGTYINLKFLFYS